MLRENYDDVQVLGFYDSPEDYVAGNLLDDAFEYVEEETPFEGDMNKQYNTDIIEEYSEEDDVTSNSVESAQHGPVKMKGSFENMNGSNLSRATSRNY